MDKHLEYYRLIGKNIAYYRKKRNLNQEGLALRANVSRTHISHIEAKNVNKAPSLEMLFNLCDALSIEPYLLFIENQLKKP